MKKKRKIKKTAASEDYALFSFDADSINHVDISCGDGDYSIQKNEDNVWNLADSDEFTVRQSTIQNIYTIMSYLTAEKDYGEATDEAKKMFGLDDPTVITLSNGTYDYTLLLGDADPTGTYYYAMTDSKSKIYAISADYGEQLEITRIMLKDCYLTNYGVSDIANIKLVRDGETAFEANYDAENTIWSLTDEYQALNPINPLCPQWWLIWSELKLSRCWTRILKISRNTASISLMQNLFSPVSTAKLISISSVITARIPILTLTFSSRTPIRLRHSIPEMLTSSINP